MKHGLWVSMTVHESYDCALCHSCAMLYKAIYRVQYLPFVG